MINVLFEPLFTALREDGGTERLGLLDLLTNAHRFSELKAYSCTGKFALIRFCIAFLSDAYRPEDTYARTDIFECGCFDRDILEKYVSACEATGVSFMLDDAHKPFMQAAYDEKRDSKAEKPVSKIFFDLPSGNNHIHCDHRLEDEHEVDTASAFESMLETYLFCPAGLSGASNVNNTPPVYALLHGRNLFETLVLNMVSKDELGNIPFGEGEVAWTRNEPIEPGASVIEMSLLKALTWQPRRLTMKWDENMRIRRIFLQNGLNFQGNVLWMDPHVIFRLTKDGSWASVKPELGRELWRDAGTLVTRGKQFRSTVPIMNINNIWPDSPDELDIELVSLITSQESVLGRVNERLKMPKELFEQEDKAQEFRDAMSIIEEMVQVLRKAVQAQFCHTSDKKKKSEIAEQTCEIFLYSMREIVFGRYLDELVACEPDTERIAHFMEDLWKALDGALKEAIETTGDSVASIKKQNEVRAGVRRYYAALRERRCGK